MKQLIALMIALSALAPKPALAEDWKTIATNQQGVAYAIKEQDSRNASNLSPLIWVKTDNSRESGARWNTSLSQVQFDCQKQNLQLFAIYTYDADGKVRDMQSFPLGQRRTTAIPTGSVWAEVARWACPR